MVMIITHEVLTTSHNASELLLEVACLWWILKVNFSCSKTGLISHISGSFFHLPLHLIICFISFTELDYVQLPGLNK